MTMQDTASRNTAKGALQSVAAFARARQLEDHLGWLAPLIPIALLTGFMLAIVIKPV